MASKAGVEVEEFARNWNLMAEIEVGGRWWEGIEVSVFRRLEVPHEEQMTPSAVGCSEAMKEGLIEMGEGLVHAMERVGLERASL